MCKKRMQRFHAWKNEEHMLQCGECAEIDETNHKMLHTMLLISISALSILAAGSLLIPEFRHLHQIYFIAVTALGILYAVCRNVRSHAGVIAVMYFYFTSLFILTGYLSLFEQPDSAASSIIGFFIVAPLVILDRSWRINLAMLAYYGLFQCGAFFLKPPDIAVEDAITGGIFTVIGLTMGAYMKWLRLSHIGNQSKLKLQSVTDVLTGLPNRRRMFEYIAESELQENCASISGVIMIDIDYFKQYNDTHGHQMGDNFLKQLGARFAVFAKRRNLEIFRYGGEEFAAFSRIHRYAQLRELAEELRTTAETLHIEFDASPFRKPTITIGFADVKQCRPENCEALIAMADTALYCAKSAGRNTVMGYLEAARTTPRAHEAAHAQVYSRCTASEVRQTVQ